VKEGFRYIMPNFHRNILYMGVTSNIEVRVLEHKFHIYKGFTSKYRLTVLVHYERFPTITQAIEQENNSNDGDVNGS
jgi:putative endonuclease